MKKLNYSFIGLVLVIGLNIQYLKAQQDPLFSQFMNIKNHINPATSGLNYKYQACVMAREQWVGVNGAPNSQLLNYSMKIDSFNSGIGINYLHDKIGFSQSSTIKMNYSYQLKFENERILSFGLAAGVMFYELKPEWNPPTSNPDSSLPEGINDAGFTSDFGVAYSTDRLNLGISTTNLSETRYTTNNSSYQSARHYYLFADYTFGSEEGLQFRPELLTRTDFVKINTQINLLGVYKGKYTFGIGVRQTDAIIAMIGWDIKKKFRVGYAYDYSINKLRSVSRGSHELVLGFYLK